MEESLSYLKQIKQAFACGETDIRTYSPLTLAYIGDCIYDLVIRTVIVEKGNRTPNSLHKMTSKYVNAAAQAHLIEAMVEKLSEEELAIYKRGRNAKSYTSAKNASIEDYRKATGLEALCGYLYLLDRFERVTEIIREGMGELEK